MAEVPGTVLALPLSSSFAHFSGRRTCPPPDNLRAVQRLRGAVFPVFRPAAKRLSPPGPPTPPLPLSISRGGRPPTPPPLFSPPNSFAAAYSPCLEMTPHASADTTV